MPYGVSVVALILYTALGCFGTSTTRNTASRNGSSDRATTLENVSEGWRGLKRIVEGCWGLKRVGKVEECSRGMNRGGEGWRGM